LPSDNGHGLSECHNIIIINKAIGQFARLINSLKIPKSTNKSQATTNTETNYNVTKVDDTRAQEQPNETTITNDSTPENYNSNDTATIITTTNHSYFVKKNDSIYQCHRSEWDTVPIVIEQYKLVFFTISKVGCTIRKQLF
jgi:hypothetical protein